MVSFKNGETNICKDSRAVRFIEETLARSFFKVTNIPKNTLGLVIKNSFSSCDNTVMVKIFLPKKDGGIANKTVRVSKDSFVSLDSQASK